MKITVTFAPWANREPEEFDTDHLRGANLSGAKLRGAKLREADLSGAKLREADLSEAILSEADLSGADLSEADLSRASLSGANLSLADLRWAILSGAILRGANIDGARLPGFQIPQEGSLIVWGKKGGNLIKMEIPAEAKRTACLINRKCRAEFVRVLEGYGVVENEYGRTVYEPGQIVRPHDYCDDIRTDCAPGIHFWLSKEEAVGW